VVSALSEERRKMKKGQSQSRNAHLHHLPNQLIHLLQIPNDIRSWG
jgi:hypothetical protein